MCALLKSFAQPVVFFSSDYLSHEPFALYLIMCLFDLIVSL